MKRFLPLIVTLLILLLGVITWQIVRNSHNGTLNLTIVPSDASITAITTGKNIHLRAGKNSLTPGSYGLTFSRDGFAGKTATEVVVKGETHSDTIALEAVNTTGLDYLTAHPDERGLAESILGQQGQARGNKAVAAHPLVNILPVTRRDFTINYGASQAHQNDPSALAIYITIGAYAGAKQEALDWITAQGFNPADYEIIYQAPNPNN